MNINLRRIIRTASKIISEPKRAIIWFFMLMFSKDQEARWIASWAYGRIPRVPITEVFPGIESVDTTILRTFDRVRGTSLDAKEILILAAIVKYTNAKSILEIGTSYGNTTLNLAANSPNDATITTIDLPPDWDGQLKIKVPKSYRNVGNRNRIGSQYKDTKYSRKIIQVFGDSVEIDWSQMSTPFDLVLIDGCHHYEYVKKDTQNAIKYLKSGGILIWHDYGAVRHVSRAVDEAAKELKINAIQGTKFAIGRIQ